MGKPDALSRRPDHGDGSADNADIVLLRPEFFAVRALQGLIATGEEDKILRDIRRGNAKSARSGVRSVRSAEWSEDQGVLMFRGRIYVPNILSSAAGSSSSTMTPVLPGIPVAGKLWSSSPGATGGRRCPGTSAPTPAPATSANGRRSGGSSRWASYTRYPFRRGAGALYPWTSSRSSPRLTATTRSWLWWTRRQAWHFIPTHTTCTAMGAANLYRKHVWKLHGLPDAFVSDRGPQFVAEFTRELYHLLGIKLSTSTAYHPQSDGQTERVNQELEQYLRVFCNERQDDWDDLLPEAEFQYNNHVHSATKFTPFMLDTGGTRAWALNLG
ncbi:putative retrotransposable element tf2 155 kda protein type 1-like [Lyophyllum shimeji]|uniref:Retrotransposable element tf2 155 kDa protein type 1-like n=1 Tax=Lyophyllum shimeji TaxID=47721 RepID=A0A9P3UL55_LYOSH|nr:putative retrotransposable element tf2 155 kda protein type 1-like [Lyophyllum shimeji]